MVYSQFYCGAPAVLYKLLPVSTSTVLRKVIFAWPPLALSAIFHEERLFQVICVLEKTI